MCDRKGSWMLYRSSKRKISTVYDSIDIAQKLWSAVSRAERDFWLQGNCPPSSWIFHILCMLRNTLA